jgi:hypothetical protein
VAGVLFWSLFRNLLARTVLEKIFKHTLGIAVIISDIDTSYDWSRVNIKGLTVLNPPGFVTAEMAYFPRVEFFFSPGELIFKRRVHFYYGGVWLERFNVIKKQDGNLNIKAVGSAKAAAAPEKKPPENAPHPKSKIMLNILQLNMGDVYFLDYSAGGKEPKVTRYHIGQMYAFENLDTFKDVADVILMYVLTESKLFKTLNITLGVLTEGISDVVVGGAKNIGDTVKGIMQVPVDMIRK